MVILYILLILAIQTKQTHAAPETLTKAGRVTEKSLDKLSSSTGIAAATSEGKFMHTTMYAPTSVEEFELDSQFFAGLEKEDGAWTAEHSKYFAFVNNKANPVEQGKEAIYMVDANGILFHNRALVSMYSEDMKHLHKFYAIFCGQIFERDKSYELNIGTVTDKTAENYYRAIVAAAYAAHKAISLENVKKNADGHLATTTELISQNAQYESLLTKIQGELEATQKEAQEKQRVIDEEKARLARAEADRKFAESELEKEKKRTKDLQSIFAQLTTDTKAKTAAKRTTLLPENDDNASSVSSAFFAGVNLFRTSADLRRLGEYDEARLESMVPNFNILEEVEDTQDLQNLELRQRRVELVERKLDPVEQAILVQEANAEAVQRLAETIEEVERLEERFKIAKAKSQATIVEHAKEMTKRAELI